MRGSSKKTGGYERQVKWPYEVRANNGGFQLVIHDGGTYAIEKDLKAMSVDGADREAAIYLRHKGVL